MNKNKKNDVDDDSNDSRPVALGLGSGAWLIAWMFTIGYAHLSFGQGVLALLLWPYYAGSAAGPH